MAARRSPPACAHARAMRLQPARFGKFQQDRLRKLIRVQIRRFLRMAQPVDQQFRPHRPTHPQSGETHLGKTAQQHRSATLVQLLQRGQRLAAVAQLAISVVFDHRDARPARRIQQRFPAGHRQTYPGRILKIRGHHQEPRLLALQHPLQLRGIHAVGAHRNSAELRAHSRQQILQAGVERIFHRHRVTRPQQHPPDQVQRLLAAVGNQQVVPRTGHLLPPRLFHQVAAQRFVSARRTQLQNIGQIPAGKHRGAGRAKLVQREQVPRRTRNREADHVLAPSAIGPGYGRIAPLQQSIPIHPAGCLGAPGYEAPATHLPRNQPLGFENLIGSRNRRPIQSKQASQFASGW